jgi:hypothetical protein
MRKSRSWAEWPPMGKAQARLFAEIDAHRFLAFGAPVKSL